MRIKLLETIHVSQPMDTGFQTMTLEEGRYYNTMGIHTINNKEYVIVHDFGSVPFLVRYDERWEGYTYPEKDAKRYRFHIVYKDGAYTDKFVATNRGDKKAYKMMLESLGEAYVKNILNITLVPEDK
jgi:hypothetical protein